MVYLLKMLSDMLQIPQPLFLFQICPKHAVKLGPTDLIHPVPPSSLDIAIARNPNQFGLTDRDLGLTEMGLQTLCCVLQLFQYHRNMQSAPPSLLDQLSVCLLPKSVSPSLCNRSNRV